MRTRIPRFLWRRRRNIPSYRLRPCLPAAAPPPKSIDASLKAPPTRRLSCSTEPDGSTDATPLSAPTRLALFKAWEILPSFIILGGIQTIRPSGVTRVTRWRTCNDGLIASRPHLQATPFPFPVERSASSPTSSLDNLKDDHPRRSPTRICLISTSSSSISFF